MATTTTKRAEKGGQFGANGEWYEGGKFINTTPDNAKGTPKKAKPRKVQVKPINDDVFAYSEGGMRQCISGFGANAVAAMESMLDKIGGPDEVDKDRVAWHIGELVRWCRYFNQKSQRLAVAADAWREFGEMVNGRRQAGEVPTDWVRDDGSPGPLTVALEAARALSK